MKDQKTKERFIELRAEGRSFSSIAEELGVSKQSLIAWSREFSFQISNLKAIELEAIQEKFSLLKKQRLETFGDNIRRIKTEIEKRSLADIPTEKLLDLWLKYFNLFEREWPETIFQQETCELPLDDFRTLNTWKA